MDRSKFCGCKGIRTCVKCEITYGLTNPINNIASKIENSYVYCSSCGLCWQGWDSGVILSHPNHTGNSFRINGIFLKNDFISSHEENELMHFLDSIPWDLSQSGRRKQNFGPKCNFKKQKLKVGSFNGFPGETRFIQERFKSIDLMKDYRTIEQCTLEYDPLRGASIDPHIDDCWVWGERIVTVNLLSESILTLRRYTGDTSKYNLVYAQSQLETNTNSENQPLIRIPMPKKSLLVLFGEARYQWEHFILRKDINQRRVCIAYREFTPMFLEGGKCESEGIDVLRKAQNFFQVTS